METQPYWEMTGALAYVGVCGEAPSVVLVEEAECISYVKETLFKWKVAYFAFYHENKEQITPQLTRIRMSKLCIRETIIE